MLILLASVGFGFQIQMDLRNHLRLLYDIRKLLLDIVNETAYTMDPMEVVLEHAIHSRNPYLNEICKEMGEGLQKKERGCGQELWQERIEAWQKRLGLSLEEKEIFAGAGCAFFGKSMGENEKSLEHYLERLDYVIDQVRGEQKEKQKVYQTVSVMSGLIISLLFLETLLKLWKGMNFLTVNLIFKIAAVGILVTVLSQVLKHSGREEHAFLTSLAGLIIVLFWIVPYIYELFETMQSLFSL